MVELVSNVVLRPHWSSLLKLGSLFIGPNTHFLCPCITWANWPIVIRHICYVRNTQFLLECCYLECEKELEWKNLTESSNGIALNCGLKPLNCDSDVLQPTVDCKGYIWSCSNLSGAPYWSCTNLCGFTQRWSSEASQICYKSILINLLLTKSN